MLYLDYVDLIYMYLFTFSTALSCFHLFLKYFFTIHTLLSRNEGAGYLFTIIVSSHLYLNVVVYTSIDGCILVQLPPVCYVPRNIMRPDMPTAPDTIGTPRVLMSTQ